MRRIAQILRKEYGLNAGSLEQEEDDDEEDGDDEEEEEEKEAGGGGDDEQELDAPRALHGAGSLEADGGKAYGQLVQENISGTDDRMLKRVTGTSRSLLIHAKVGAQEPMEMEDADAFEPASDSEGDNESTISAEEAADRKEQEVLLPILIRGIACN